MNDGIHGDDGEDYDMVVMVSISTVLPMRQQYSHDNNSSRNGSDDDKQMA